MAEPIPPDEQINYETFRECLSEPVLRALSAPNEKTEKKKKKKRAARKSKDGKDGATETREREEEAQSQTATVTEDKSAAAEDLADFIDYLSSLIFPTLPADLRTLTYSKFKDSSQLQNRYSTPLSVSTSTDLIDLIPPAALDSLTSYALLPTAPDALDLHHLFTPLLNAYVTAVTAPPPIWSSTRTSACELCGRDWIPLTYHHLIPKSTHERVLKRGWHGEEMLGRVAWLCRACHSFVHRLASNEELARGLYSVELIQDGGIERDEDIKSLVEGWIEWVGSVRWKSR